MLHSLGNGELCRPSREGERERVDGREANLFRLLMLTAEEMRMKQMKENGKTCTSDSD